MLCNVWLILVGALLGEESGEYEEDDDDDDDDDGNESDVEYEADEDAESVGSLRRGILLRSCLRL